MKDKYVSVKVRTIEFLRGDSVLSAVGSITETKIVVDGENVSVDPLKSDIEFDTSDFKNITF